MQYALQQLSYCSARTAKRKWKEFIEHVQQAKENLNVGDKLWSRLAHMQMQLMPEIGQLL